MLNDMICPKSNISARELLRIALATEPRAQAIPIESDVPILAQVLMERRGMFVSHNFLFDEWSKMYHAN